MRRKVYNGRRGSILKKIISPRNKTLRPSVNRVKGQNAMGIVKKLPRSQHRQPDSDTLDALLEKTAYGDMDALAELYHETSSAVYGFALSILKNSHDAEDVLHDCYVVIANSADRYRAHGKPLAWILTIARNLCMEKFRERKKTAVLPEEDWESRIAADPGLTLEDRSVLRECLTILSPEERQIVALHAIGGFLHREIAAIMDMPLATVLSKYSRALKKLRKHMEGETV